MEGLTKNPLVELELRAKQIVNTRKSQAEELLKRANEVELKIDDDIGQTNIIITTIRSLHKAIESARLEKTRPITAEVAKIKAVFDSVITPLKEADTILQQKLMFYRQKRLAEEQAKRDAVEKEAQRRANISKAKGGDGTIKTPVPAPIDNFSHQDTTKVAKVWGFEVTDKTKLPAEYLLVDNVAIRDKMRAAVRAETIKELEIPGVKFEQKEQFRT